MGIGAFVVVMFLAFGGFGGGSEPSVPERLVSRVDVTPWPFTVDAGVLRCRTHTGVTFQPAGGVEYGLNGSAQAMGYPSPEVVWAADPAVAGLRLDLGPAIALGQALC